MAEDKWWDKMKLENPTIEKFRFKRLQFSHELEHLFNNVATMGYCNWAPSSMALEPGENEGYGNDEGVTLIEEESGDYDDVARSPTGISGELNRVTFLSSQGNSGEASVKKKGPMSSGNALGVRKAGYRKKKKKAKGPTSNVIVECLSDMVGIRRSAMERANEEA